MESYVKSRRLKKMNKKSKISSIAPSKLKYDYRTVPQIIHYYYKGKQKVSASETIIPIYFTDWYQREYYHNDNSLRFNLRLDLDGNVSYINNLPAGDYNLSLGVLDVGEHEYSIEVTQVNNGLRSQRLFNKIWIVDDSNDITEEQTYQIKDTDLNNYNITLNLDETATSEQLTNNRHGLKNMFADFHKQGYRKIVLPKDSYIRINMQYADETEVDRFGRYIPQPIVIPTNTTIDLNGSTIKLQPYNDLDYPSTNKVEASKGGIHNYMMVFESCIDSHLVNGTFEGDYFERKNEQFHNSGTEEEPIWENGLSGGNGEHCSCLEIRGGAYNTIENITIKQITGYNLSCEKPKLFEGKYQFHPNGSDAGVNMTNTWGENKGCWDKYPNTDLINGIETPCNGRMTSDYVDLTNIIKCSNYFSAGKYITDYPTGGYYYENRFTFYDENKVYIEDYVGYQARIVKVPNGAKYIRVTLNEPNFDAIASEPTYFLILPYQSEYNEWNNIEFIDNRTCCNPNRFKHLRLYNCNFTRSGQSITPLAIDAEDGGATMQDLFVENCSIKEYAETQTGDCIAVGGLNFVFQNNNNLSFGIRAEVIGATIRNNILGKRSSQISPGWRTGHTIRCYNNDFIGRYDTSLGNSPGLYVSNHPTRYSQVKVKNCRNINYCNGWQDDFWLKYLIFEDCENLQMGFNTHHKHNTFYVDSTLIDPACMYTGNSIFENCTFTCQSDDVGTIEWKSANYGEQITSIGRYINCNFDMKNKNIYLHPWKENAFIKGYFVGCMFNSPIKIELIYENNLGDIEINKCTFNKKVTLDLRNNCKIKFINCTFNDGITYLNDGEQNSSFIGCIGL